MALHFNTIVSRPDAYRYTLRPAFVSDGTRPIPAHESAVDAPSNDSPYVNRTIGHAPTARAAAAANANHLSAPSKRARTGVSPVRSMSPASTGNAAPQAADGRRRAAPSSRWATPNAARSAGVAATPRAIAPIRDCRLATSPVIANGRPR